MSAMISMRKSFFFLNILALSAPSNELFARSSSALHEDTQTQEETHGKKSAKGQSKRASFSSNSASFHQGQASSSVYKKEYASITVDLDGVGSSSAGDITFGQTAAVGAEAVKGQGYPNAKTPKAKFAITTGSGVKAVSKDTLNKAKAADALKKKLERDARQAAEKALDLAKMTEDEKNGTDPVMELVTSSHSTASSQ